MRRSEKFDWVSNYLKSEKWGYLKENAEFTEEVKEFYKKEKKNIELLLLYITDIIEDEKVGNLEEKKTNLLELLGSEAYLLFEKYKIYLNMENYNDVNDEDTQ